MSQSKNAFQYQELPACDEIAPWVLNLWCFRVNSLEPAGYDHSVPPDGCVSLVARYPEGGGKPELLLVGPRIETFSVQIHSLDQYLGVRLWPQAAYPLLGDQLQDAFNFVGPAFFKLGELAGQLTARLPAAPDAAALEDSFAACLKSLPSSSRAVDELVSTAVGKIVMAKGNCRIQEVADSLKVNVRQLQRRFLAATGLTPKQFARLRRFRAAAAELISQQPRPWVEVAYSAGFADQSHLTREFSQLIGLTAEELRQKQSDIDHDGVEP